MDDDEKIRRNLVVCSSSVLAYSYVSPKFAQGPIFFGLDQSILNNNRVWTVVLIILIYLSIRFWHSVDAKDNKRGILEEIESDRDQIFCWLIKLDLKIYKKYKRGIWIDTVDYAEQYARFFNGFIHGDAKQILSIGVLGIEKYYPGQERPRAIIGMKYRLPGGFSTSDENMGVYCNFGLISRTVCWVRTIVSFWTKKTFVEFLWPYLLAASATFTVIYRMCDKKYSFPSAPVYWNCFTCFLT